MGFIIYKYTNNINSKVYVGLTKLKLEKRHSAHLSASRSGSKQPIHRAIRKYGDSTFVLSVLKNGIKTLDEAEHFEKLHIRRENSFGSSGYNATKGGFGTIGVKGESHPRHKLTEKQTTSIIFDNRAHSVVAKDYSMSNSTIQGIRDGTSWCHLDRSKAPKYQKYVRLTDKDTAMAIITDPLGHADTARKYFVPLSYVHSIRHRRSWKHLDRSLAPKYENKR